MKPRRPFAAPLPRVRQRQRADGSWRVWWEPEAAIRSQGFATVELDAARLTWSQREATRLNRLVEDARAGRSPKKAAGRTVAELIRAYKTSPFWDALRPATRTDYQTCFRQIEAKWGDALIADFTKGIIREWYETLYRTSGVHMAASLIRKLSLLLTYAERRDWIPHNPCLRIGVVQPPRRSRVASWEEVDALLAAADAVDLPLIGVAVLLSAFQGRRETDILELEPGGIEGMVWKLRQSKRRKVVAVDLHPEVLPRLAAAIAGAGNRETLIAAPNGQPYDTSSFGHAFARVREKAAETQPQILNLQFRDLRRTAAHQARLGGASERDVGDMLGNKAWTDAELSAVYMPATHETASRAVMSIRRKAKS